MARLSGSVSDIWLSPVRLEVGQHRRHQAGALLAQPRAAIFSARFLVRAPPTVPPSSRHLALVQPLKIIANRWASAARINSRSELRVKLRSLLLTALIPRAVHRQQLAAVEIEPPAQQHEFPEHRPKGGAVVAPEVGDGLEVLVQPPGAARSLRCRGWVSASSRRLDRTRFK